jgi:tripartite-type tricarboxylate transporter receptor subunit TctC
MSRKITLLLLISFMALNTWAREFPNKPVRIIVGSGADQIARLLAERLSATWGQPVIVENRLSAGGLVAADSVAKSAPDGTNLLFSSSAYPLLQITKSKLPFHFFDDLTPAIVFSKSTFVVVVNKDLPVTHLQDLIQLAKTQQKNGGKQLNYASVGPGTTSNIAGEMLNQEGQISIVHVPYKSFPAALTDLISGEVQVLIAPLSSLFPMIKDGKIKAIAVSTDRRDPYLPDLPTFAEQGYPNMTFIGWNGFHLNAKTPPEIVRKIYSDTAKVISEPDFISKAQQMGYQLMSLNPEEAKEMQLNDFKKFSVIVKKSNIIVD